MESKMCWIQNLTCVCVCVLGCFFKIGFLNFPIWIYQEKKQRKDAILCLVVVVPPKLDCQGYYDRILITLNLNFILGNNQ